LRRYRQRCDRQLLMKSHLLDGQLLLSSTCVLYRPVSPDSSVSRGTGYGLGGRSCIQAGSTDCLFVTASRTASLEVKRSTDQPVAKSIIVELRFHSPICFHGVVLISTANFRHYLNYSAWSCHSSGGQSLVSHRSGLGHAILDLWLTKWHCGRFSPRTSASLANHSTDCSTFIVIHLPGLVRPELWRQKNLLLHHDNAPSHTSFFNTEFLSKTNMARLPPTLLLSSPDWR
jgi:hypothetical protein